MPKPTLQNVADELGCTLKDIQRAKKDGVNPYDRESVKRWLDNKREYTPRKKLDDEAPPVTFGDELLTIEEIERNALRPGQTKRDVEVSKVQVAVLREVLAYKVQRNKLLSREEIDDRDSRIMHALQGMFRRMENEIPALCYGLNTMGEMKDVVKAKVRELQNTYADGMSEFWRSYPES